jgi:hypothetical protein
LIHNYGSRDHPYIYLEILKTIVIGDIPYSYVTNHQRLNIIFFLGIQGTTMGINGITSSRNRFPSHGGFPIGKKTKNIFSKSKFYDLKEVMSEKW